jgi:hypothetical protein
MLGALVAGVGWIGMYVGLSYFLGAEIAERIGNAGSKAVLGVILRPTTSARPSRRTRSSLWRPTMPSASPPRAASSRVGSRISEEGGGDVPPMWAFPR